MKQYLGHLVFLCLVVTLLIYVCPICAQTEPAPMNAATSSENATAQTPTQPAATPAAVIATETASSNGVENGARAPDFTLPDPDGKMHTLSQYAFNWVVLEWTNYDCPFVRKHYDSGAMQELQKMAVEKGVIWLSINSSAPGKQGNFSNDVWKKRIAEQKVAATAVLLDPDGTVGRQYDAKTTPHLFVINPEGLVMYQGAIDSIRSTDAADIARAVPYVRQVLEAALAGKDLPQPTRTPPYGCSVKY